MHARPVVPRHASHRSRWPNLPQFVQNPRARKFLKDLPVCAKIPWDVKFPNTEPLVRARIVCTLHGTCACIAC